MDPAQGRPLSVGLPGDNYGLPFHVADGLGRWNLRWDNLPRISKSIKDRRPRSRDTLREEFLAGFPVLRACTVNYKGLKSVYHRAATRHGLLIAERGSLASTPCERCVEKAAGGIAFFTGCYVVPGYHKCCECENHGGYCVFPRPSTSPQPAPISCRVPSSVSASTETVTTTPTCNLSSSPATGPSSSLAQRGSVSPASSSPFQPSPSPSPMITDSPPPSLQTLHPNQTLTFSNSTQSSDARAVELEDPQATQLAAQQLSIQQATQRASIREALMAEAPNPAIRAAREIAAAAFSLTEYGHSVQAFQEGFGSPMRTPEGFGRSVGAPVWVAPTPWGSESELEVERVEHEGEGKIEGEFENEFDREFENRRQENA